MLITAAIIQRFSLPGKTGGYDPSESGSPGALQEHRVGGGMSVWSTGGSRSLIPSAAALLGPKTSLLEIRLFLMACLCVDTDVRSAASVVFWLSE